MTKKIDALAMLKRMRETAQTGMESGVWFSPIEENVGVELFGNVTRLFDYEYDNETRLAFEMRLLVDSTFTVAKEGETETISVAAGELVLVGLSGQLRYLFEKHNVMPGTTVFLKYEGKDTSRKIRGNHPHTWTYAFADPSRDEVAN